MTTIYKIASAAMWQAALDAGTFGGAPIAVPGVEIRQRISVGKLGINYRF